MNVYLSSKYLRNFKRIVKRNPGLLPIIKERIKIFQQNPNHTLLRLHKLTGNKENVWSFSIKDDLRILLVYAENGIVFADIGKHEEVY